MTNLLFLLLILSPDTHLRSPANADQKLAQLANRVAEQQIDYDPTGAYFSGTTIPGNVRFPNRSTHAIEARTKEEARDLQQLNKIEASLLQPSSRALYASLREELESDLQLRVCKHELWNVDHYSGWQVSFAQVASREPVDTRANRADALTRWTISFPLAVDTEIANLRLGLATGYSAPQSVVHRVILQVDAMISDPPERSPFYSPAARSQDAAFQVAMTKAIATQVNPALTRYRDFLQNHYLPRARTSIAVSELPNGAACYQAFLRSNTTLNKTAAEVYELGQKTIATYQAKVLRIGEEAYGENTMSGVLAAEKADPAVHFTSREDLLTASRDMLENARAITSQKVVNRMPKQGVVIEPLSAAEEAAGANSRMEPQPDSSKPAIFRIDLSKWKTETRGEAEVVVAHEVYPGHGLQIPLASEIHRNGGQMQQFTNLAFTEGWARYAEGIAEEVGILSSADARIQRRLASQGLLIDPGLHAFHWTRQQAIDSLVGTGRYSPSRAESVVDRIAAMPGSLTAYDMGRLEIQSLRKEAQTKLGESFDLRAFDEEVIEEDGVPLPELRRSMELWIEQRIPGGH